MRDTQREAETDRQREKQAPCREPDVGLDPRTPGSQPEPKADAQPLSHPGAQITIFKRLILFFSLENFFLSLEFKLEVKPGFEVTSNY